MKKAIQIINIILSILAIAMMVTNRKSKTIILILWIIILLKNIEIYVPD